MGKTKLIPHRPNEKPKLSFRFFYFNTASKARFCKWYKNKKNKAEKQPWVFLFQDNLKGKNEANPSSPTNK
jgi:hypothetical protein